MSEHTDTDRDEQLLASLDPATAKLLFPERFVEPIEVTLVCPPVAPETGAALGKLAGDARVSVDPAGGRRLTFTLAQLESLHETYLLLEQESAAFEVLIDGKQVPMVRELWLPLMWGLLS